MPCRPITATLKQVTQPVTAASRGSIARARVQTTRWSSGRIDVMSGSHSHGTADANVVRLGWTLALVVLYAAAEVVGGLASGSLALLADAGHMVSDAAAIGLTLFAMRFARRPPSPTRTFGYYRAEILAALVNGATLVGIAIFILS